MEEDPLLLLAPLFDILWICSSLCKLGESQGADIWEELVAGHQERALQLQSTDAVSSADQQHGNHQERSVRLDTFDGLRTRPIGHHLLSFDRLAAPCIR